MKAITPKLQMYEALHKLNRGLEQVLADLDLTRLMGLGFRRHFQIVLG